MKILFTHEIFAPDYFGGGELEVYEIMTRLKQRGYEIKFVTMGYNKDFKKMCQKISELNGQKIEDVETRMKGIEIKRIPGHRYLMNFMLLPILYYAHDCDIIHTNTFNAALPSYIAAKILRKPVVCFVHGLYGDMWKNMRGLFFGSLSKFFERLQIKHNFDKVIFQADYAREEGVKIGVPIKNTVVIKPGLFYNFDRYNVGEKKPFVLYVGRLAKQKGLDYLIEAAKMLPKVKFVLVGKGEEENRLREIAPSNVEFRGFVTENEKLELLSNAMIFCLPSLQEGFGLVLIEAMASGCAVISTIPLEFEGAIIRKQNPHDIVAAVEKLLKNQTSTKKMGIRNRDKAKEYNWDAFIDRLCNIYEELMGKHSHQTTS